MSFGKCRIRIKLLFLMMAVLLTSLFPAAGGFAYYGAKFEPEDGKIISSAGQRPYSIAPMMMTADPDRKPMLVATYASLLNTNLSADVLAAPTLYPGAYIQFGMSLGYGDTELDNINAGLHDETIRALARRYKEVPANLFIRIGTEFNARQFDSGKYILAYQRIWNLFASEGTDNVAWVWTSSGRRMWSEIESYYPGDDYVDWFGYDQWAKSNVNVPIVPRPSYLAAAASRSKPIMLGETGANYMETNGEDWMTVGPKFFTELKDSGAKAFNYINFDWETKYGIGTTWGKARYTDDPAWISVYNTEMQDSTYLHRDSSFYQPIALSIEFGMGIPNTDYSQPGLAWSQSADAGGKLSGYDYSITTAGATIFSTDSSNSKAYWLASSSGELEVELTVPDGSSGYITLVSSTVDYDLYVGSRQVLAAVSHASRVKFAYGPADITGGKVKVKLSKPGSTDLRLGALAIQTVSAAAPAAPSGLQVVSQSEASVGLGWTAVAGAEAYAVYRDGELIGYSQTTTFTDGPDYQYADIPHVYAVAAFDDHQGVGWMSGAVATEQLQAVLSPAADAYAYGDPARLETNYGLSSQLLMKNGTGDAYDRIPYLQFSLTGVPLPQVQSARLRVFVNSVSEPVTISVFETGDNWTETGLTWNNRPAMGGLIAQAESGSGGSFVEWDVTAAVQAQLAGDGIFSAALWDDAQTTALVSLSSRQGANPPQLIIDARDSLVQAGP